MTGSTFQLYSLTQLAVSLMAWLGSGVKGGFEQIFPALLGAAGDGEGDRQTWSPLIWVL